MQDDLSQLRSSLRRPGALAQQPAQRRVIEAFPQSGATTPRRRFTFWQITLHAIPIIVAVISTSLLAYFMLFSPQWERFLERGSQASQEQDAAQSASPEGQQPLSGPQQQPAQPIPADLGPRLPMPSDAKLVTLIASTLLSLNQANATANYTALRDGAAPDFQRTQSPDHLAEIFKDLRARNVDLSTIVLHRPTLFRRPEMNEQGMVRVSGVFPTQPERIVFDLIYQPVQGRWRLLGIAVETRPASAQPAAAPPQARSAPSADSPQSDAAPTETSKAEKPPAQAEKPPAQAEKPPAEEAEKPPAPSPKPKEKPGATQQPDAASQNAKPEIDDDVRDRIENLKPKPKAEKPKDEKPKEKNTWNPFSR